MKNGQMRLRLSAGHGGAYTRLQLSGFVPTAVPRKTAIALARGLALWSGWPVRCVLSVGRKEAGWFEWWTDVLAVVPEDLLELRYDIVRTDRPRRTL
jgi:hypothetical protein